MSRQEMWGVWCSTRGGVTGHREAWAKGKDGNPMVFASEAEAGLVAAAWRARLSPYGPAIIGYSARPYDGPAFATEPTDQGNQYIIPGCERDRSRGPKQGDLF